MANANPAVFAIRDAIVVIDQHRRSEDFPGISKAETVLANVCLVLVLVPFESHRNSIGGRSSDDKTNFKERMCLGLEETRPHVVFQCRAVRLDCTADQRQHDAMKGGFMVDL